MTVREYIEALETFDPDLKVHVRNPHANYYDPSDYEEPDGPFRATRKFDAPMNYEETEGVILT